LALLSYPVLMEPWLGLAEQARFWALGYGGLVFLVAGCVLLVWRRSSESSGQSAAPLTMPSLPEAAGEGSRVLTGTGSMETAETLSWRRRLRWLALAFVPSSLMLGVTTYVTTDLAPIPLLWILPLSVYLLSFVLAFSRLPTLFYHMAAVALPTLIAALIALQINRLVNFGWHLELSHPQLISLHLVTFFVAALVCHGELATRRPSTGRLTEYYLWIAMGGMFGGVFNSIIAPLAFDRIVEYPLLFAAVCLLCPSFGCAEGKLAPTSIKRHGWRSTILTVAWLAYGSAAAYCLLGLSLEAGRHNPWRSRNFFGTLVATYDRETNISRLVHGTTLHGTQDLATSSTRLEPQSYYTATSGIHRLFDVLAARPPRTVGVTGLGAGTVAAFARPGQHWIFYEINPAVPRIARDPSYFTYLEDAERRGVRVQTVLGDARLSIASSPLMHDLFIIDAFSSDAIPVHLLTREAWQVYLAKLSAHGIMAFQITNQYLDLTPVIANLCRDLGLHCLFYADDPPEPNCASWWMVAARNPDDLAPLRIEGSCWQSFKGYANAHVWTDDFSNLYTVLHLAGVPDVPQAAREEAGAAGH
jgi:hypothetical protein